MSTSDTRAPQGAERLPVPTWKLLHTRRPDGHALFTRNGDARHVYVADASGSTPDRTDDGPLAIDVRALQGLTLRASSYGRMVASLSVKCRDGVTGPFSNIVQSTRHVSLIAEQAALIAQIAGVPLVVDVDGVSFSPRMHVADRSEGYGAHPDLDLPAYRVTDRETGAHTVSTWQCPIRDCQGPIASITASGTCTCWHGHTSA